MKKYANNTSIKFWAEEDRPREKFLSLGKKSMTNAELLSLILGSGSRSTSAVQLAQNVLDAVDHRLSDLSDQSIRGLMNTKGIGSAKAISVLACFELGKRWAKEAPQKIQFITGSQDAYDIMNPMLSDLPHEEFHIILLKRSGAIIKTKLISRGGITSTIVDNRLIFQSALEHFAVSIILCHNHPSGSTKPSQSDIDLTKQLVKAGKMMNIGVLDHIIVGREGYLSFADTGLL